MTKEIWEDVIGEFPKMWMQDTYEGYEGKYWSLPPRKILPRPYGKAHAPMWYAAGNPPSYEMAGRMGLGVLGFSLDSLDKVEKLRSAYKNGIANAEPVGAFANDNIMSCIAAYVAEDKQKAIDSYVNCKPNYLVSNVYRYHDTFPRPGTSRRGRSCCPTARRRWPSSVRSTAASSSAVRRRARAVQALGRDRHRPARLRHRAGADRRDPRDDPADGRARHPEDRHRPGAPHHALSFPSFFCF